MKRPGGNGLEGVGIGMAALIAATTWAGNLRRDVLASDC
jgi:hypothetical protein